MWDQRRDQSLTAGTVSTFKLHRVGGLLFTAIRFNSYCLLPTPPCPIIAFLSTPCYICRLWRPCLIVSLRLLQTFRRIEKKWWMLSTILLQIVLLQILPHVLVFWVIYQNLHTSSSFMNNNHQQRTKTNSNSEQQWDDSFCGFELNIRSKIVFLPKVDKVYK